MYVLFGAWICTVARDVSVVALSLNNQVSLLIKFHHIQFLSVLTLTKICIWLEASVP